MIAALVTLSVVGVGNGGILLLVLKMHNTERRDWVAERRSLVDRVIAQHSGEVIALDRNQRPPRERTPQPEPVGLG